jgi:hypothetical protein
MTDATAASSTNVQGTPSAISRWAKFNLYHVVQVLGLFGLFSHPKSVPGEAANQVLKLL